MQRRVAVSHVGRRGAEATGMKKKSSKLPLASAPDQKPMHQTGVPAAARYGRRERETSAQRRKSVQEFGTCVQEFGNDFLLVLTLYKSTKFGRRRYGSCGSKIPHAGALLMHAGEGENFWVSGGPNHPSIGANKVR